MWHWWMLEYNRWMKLAWSAGEFWCMVVQRGFHRMCAAVWNLFCFAWNQGVIMLSLIAGSCMSDPWWQFKRGQGSFEELSSLRKLIFVSMRSWGFFCSREPKLWRSQLPEPNLVLFLTLAWAVRNLSHRQAMTFQTKVDHKLTLRKLHTPMTSADLPQRWNLWRVSDSLFCLLRRVFFFGLEAHNTLH